MHKTITYNDQEYELQITVRKVIKNGTVAVSLDNTEAETLLKSIEQDLYSAVGVVDYAAEQKEYEASYEPDDEIRHSMKRSAKDMEDLGDRLWEMLEGKITKER